MSFLISYVSHFHLSRLALMSAQWAINLAFTWRETLVDFKPSQEVLIIRYFIMPSTCVCFYMRYRFHTHMHTHSTEMWINCRRVKDFCKNSSNVTLRWHCAMSRLRSLVPVHLGLLLPWPYLWREFKMWPSLRPRTGSAAGSRGLYF